EGGLEGVLRVVAVAQGAPADAPDHRAVPPHQRRERRLLAAAAETLQQLSVGGLIRRLGLRQALDLGEEGTGVRSAHRGYLTGRDCPKDRGDRGARGWVRRTDYRNWACRRPQEWGTRSRSLILIDVQGPRGIRRRCRCRAHADVLP